MDENSKTYYLLLIYCMKFVYTVNYVMGINLKKISLRLLQNANKYWLNYKYE